MALVSRWSCRNRRAARISARATTTRDGTQHVGRETAGPWLRQYRRPPDRRSSGREQVQFSYRLPMGVLVRPAPVSGSVSTWQIRSAVSASRSARSHGANTGDRRVPPTKMSICGRKKNFAGGRDHQAGTVPRHSELEQQRPGRRHRIDARHGGVVRRADRYVPPRRAGGQIALVETEKRRTGS